MCANPTMNDALFILALNDIRGVGFKAISKVLETGLSPEEILENPETLSRHKIIKLHEIIKNLKESRAELLSKAQKQLDKAHDIGAKVISIRDPTYPAKLKKSKEPPLLLFCKGNTSLMNKPAVAVIGSRKGCDIGKLIARVTVEAIGGSGVVIVAGLALGIDTVAHQTALDILAPTIAVLPDLGNLVPKENMDLANKIIDSGGLLVSDNIPYHRINKGDFIKRDRIQAALSEAIFPIQTSPTGGSMHAVNEAIRLNVPIYCPDYSYFINSGKVNKNTPEIVGITELIDSGKAVAYAINASGANTSSDTVLDSCIKIRLTNKQFLHWDLILL